MLASRSEHAMQLQKRQENLTVPALVQSNAALAEPFQIPGVNYHEIKITGPAYEKFLISHLTWTSFL